VAFSVAELGNGQEITTIDYLRVVTLVCCYSKDIMAARSRYELVHQVLFKPLHRNQPPAQLFILIISPRFSSVASSEGCKTPSSWQLPNDGQMMFPHEWQAEEEVLQEEERQRGEFLHQVDCE